MVRKIKKKSTLTKKQAEKDLKEKLNMFDKLPEECTACDAPFDKKNRDMLNSWNVIVRTRESVVRLYCPPCWERALGVLESLTEKK
jgi:predicted RNA-binding Zn-ribbon protein involved in translation (DUF1610 family)